MGIDDANVSREKIKRHSTPEFQYLPHHTNALFSMLRPSLTALAALVHVLDVTVRKFFLFLPPTEQPTSPTPASRNPVTVSSSAITPSSPPP